MNIYPIKRRRLFIGLALILVGLWGCTNSKPVRPENASVIYASIANIYFTEPSQEISFALRYLGGYGSLAWHVSSKPDWVELFPDSGYLTGEFQYVTARLNGAVVAYLAKGTYSGLLTIYSSEGSKDIPVTFVYSK
ncbi:MAG: hypothetical protein A2509_01815 [Candidatus Edwardsbacteria bacterium RIFOXYD12_FULL_50_11]|uniref:BACON domain-containing protein n=1 Tax=Candidatus Edwardsbacteria bacterium GWF2_54_11 TaxID=1817851 RepID=A0A1F5RCT0_9BACT|nr:MAG: hypothetical protein A2502_03140 [Candidatus Edwardsbacteria bacterium RifOxyC12_full_54_24]OGF07710.1 MAG: hypothetical protein A2273_04390 [Candidatus Edwardsbacteria bacterium RifOxyA12_full_54_48]OGF09961.1 MAG: hypothetical protein A3K15_10800 [Candidatus Edwardsbacteria bacterium GWE2_54_12]OGF12222.1 MAG: hypothetical protein A2024_04355 [Candidatus Edwardsbacteria bacterium GWF2_54_11]OGF16322.1 MAG: hypothetical protein A2509_01815 [Candidatus Edwardsbacteria bacterium RIFOXYD1